MKNEAKRLLTNYRPRLLFAVVFRAYFCRKRSLFSAAVIKPKQGYKRLVRAKLRKNVFKAAQSSTKKDSATRRKERKKSYRGACTVMSWLGVVSQILDPLSAFTYLLAHEANILMINFHDKGPTFFFGIRINKIQNGCHNSWLLFYRRIRSFLRGNIVWKGFMEENWVSLTFSILPGVDLSHPSNRKCKKVPSFSWKKSQVFLWLIWRNTPQATFPISWKRERAIKRRCDFFFISQQHLFAQWGTFEFAMPSITTYCYQSSNWLLTVVTTVRAPAKIFWWGYHQ